MTTPNAEELQSGQYRLQGLSRALDVLDIFAAEDDRLSVSELARRLSCSKSTAFALLQTLEGRNFVSSIGEGFQRRYTLGLGLARLGHRAASRASLVDDAMPSLQRLSRMTKLSSRVATVIQGSAIVVGQVDRPSSVRFDLNMGGRERLHCTGIGKAILSKFSDEEVADIAEQTGLPRRTEHTITTLPALLEDLKRIRARGFAVDDEEDADGVVCIGAPLLDHTQTCIGGISVTGLKSSMSTERAMQVGEAVAQTAEYVSARLGASA